MTKKTCTYLQVLEVERGERVLVVVVPSPGLPRFERGYQQGLDLLYDQRGAFKVAGEVAGALWGGREGEMRCLFFFARKCGKIRSLKTECNVVVTELDWIGI